MTARGRYEYVDAIDNGAPGADHPVAVQIGGAVRRLIAELGRAGSPRDALVAARDLSAAAEAAMQAAIDLARGAGYSWREIGEVLGTTRQAAFQRFGHPVDPRTGEPTSRDIPPDAADRAVAIFAWHDEGRWDEILAQLDERMGAHLDADRLARGWAHMAGLFGRFEGASEPFARRAGDDVMVDVRLHWEAGDARGIVRFDAEGKVAGLAIRPLPADSGADMRVPSSSSRAGARMGFSRRRVLMLAAAAMVGMGMSGCATHQSEAAAPIPAPTPPDIAAAPTHIADTVLGDVGYREVGHGPTLLMITGFNTSMDGWAPYFVDALAAHFRVVVFDNAGIGQTATLAPLSVPEMAAQTSALISRLGIDNCDVLGWSMGGLIAQSLAVTHPGQVRRLVLAATQPGTGKAAPVPSAIQAALDSGNAAAALSVLFPAGQVAATERYLAGIRAYPGFYTASAAMRAEQQTAVDQWFAGDDASGRHPGDIRAPTLVADGTEDALNPVSNDGMLARLIHGAHLVLYPGAGHGFLFQDAQGFVDELRSFLG